MLNKGLLYLTIIAGFLGSAFLYIDIGPFSLFPFRILIFLMWLLFLLGIFIKEGKLNISYIRVKHYFIFLILWLVYSIFSIAWAADKTDAIQYNFLLLMGISLIFFVVFYFKNLKDLERLYTLWIVMLIILISIGLWNHLTGHQLSVSGYAQQLGPARFIPTAVFSSQNDYATYLALSLPFVYSFISHNKSLSKRLISVAILGCGIYLLLITEARANYLAVILGVIFWFFFLLKTKIKIKALALTAVIVLLLLVAFPDWTNELFEEFNLEMRSVFTGLDVELGSVFQRLNVIRNGWIFFISSYGLGVGAGNIEYYMANFPSYDTYGALAAHNWLIEILVNWGVVIFVGYILMYLGIIIRLWRIHSRLVDTSEKMICEALLVSLVSLFFAGMSSGSIMAFAVIWLLFGFSLAFINYTRIECVLHR